MTYIKQFTLTPPERVNDDQPFTTLNIREAETAAGPYTVIDTQPWTDTTPSTGAATAVETTAATLEHGVYQFQWVDGTGAVTQWWGPVSSTSGFCSTDDIAARLAITDWQAAELARCQLLIDLATDTILAEVGKDAAWAAQTPVPDGLRSLCIEMVARVMVNPSGVRSESEQLGSWQRSVSYSDSGHQLEMSQSERLRARAAVYGSNSGSAQATSLADDLAEVVELPPALPATSPWV